MDFSTAKVMGIINTTPDSFYKHSRTNQSNIEHISKKMVDDDVDIFDVGGQSSRPGAERISSKEELQRILPIIEYLLKHYPDIPISVDTFYHDVAEEVLNIGVAMINDISGGDLDNHMIDVIATRNIPYVTMHMKGSPKDMNQQASYTNLIEELLDYFFKKIEVLKQRGILDIIIDPGIGFAKTAAHNFELLHRLDEFNILNSPILVGLSRKSFIYNTLNTSSEHALNGTTAMHVIALLNGANLLRVHDVKEAKETITLLHGI